MSTVFTIYSSRPCHDINFKSKKGRFFTLDIEEASPASYESEVTARDPLSPNAGSWVYKTKPSSASADDNFLGGARLIQDYLQQIDPTDEIIEIHNPCNCPFVSEANQNRLLSSVGMALTVKVN